MSAERKAPDEQRRSVPKTAGGFRHVEKKLSVAAS